MQRNIPATQELVLAEGDTSRITLPALMDVAVEAMYVDFRKLLEESGIDDVRPTHGCVFRFVHGDGMRLTELASLAGLTKQSVGEIVDDLDRASATSSATPIPPTSAPSSSASPRRAWRPRASASPSSTSSKPTGPRPSAADRISALRSLLEEIALAKAPDAVPRAGPSRHRPRTRSHRLIR